MTKIRNAIFITFGVIGLLLQLLGLYIILILIGIITKTWLVLLIIGIGMTIIDYWKKSYFRKKGYESHFLGYTKPKKEENENNK